MVLTSTHKLGQNFMKDVIHSVIIDIHLVILVY